MNNSFPTNSFVINDIDLGYFIIEQTEITGQVICYKKHGVITHTAIGLGYDHHRKQNLIVHHSIFFDGPRIDILDESIEWYYHEKLCSNPPLVAVNKALNLVIDGCSYDLWNYNCEVVSNIACHNQSYSEQSRSFSNILLLFGFGLLFKGMVS